MTRLLAAIVAVCVALCLAGGTDAAAPPLPTGMAAIGDSISAGWGSATDASGANLWGINVADSWSTGDDPAVASFYRRLLRLARGTQAMTAVNLARPGTPSVDPAYGWQAQAREVPDSADYVVLGGGSADVCGETVTSPDRITPVAQLTAALRGALDLLHRRLPRARVFIASVPTWTQLRDDPTLRALPRPSYACPLLFGPGATDATERAVGDAIAGYNAAFAAVCADPAYAGFCRYDGGAAARLHLTRDDLSTVDYFHLTRTGQARLAAATWPTTGFGAAPTPAEPAPVEPPAPAQPQHAQAPRPQEAAPSRRVVTIAASVTVQPAALLRVVLVPQHAGSSLPLLRRSAVGRSVSGVLHSTIFGRARGRVPIVLRVAARALAHGHAYRIVVTAMSGGGTARLSIPFTA